MLFTAQLDSFNLRKICINWYQILVNKITTYRNRRGLPEDDSTTANVTYFSEHNVFFKDFYLSKTSKACFSVRRSLFFTIACVIGTKDCQDDAVIQILLKIVTIGGKTRITDKISATWIKQAICFWKHTRYK